MAFPLQQWLRERDATQCIFYMYEHRCPPSPFFAPKLDKMATYEGRTESENVCWFGRVLSKTAFFFTRENSDLISS